MSQKFCQYLGLNGERHHKGGAPCFKAAIVGWGNPAMWLCQQHFEVALADTRKLIDKLDNMVRASFPDDQA